MTKKESFPSRKGNRRKICRKVIGLLITFLISIFIMFGTKIVVHSSSGLEVSAQVNKRFRTDIIESYVKELENKGYEDVNYELSYIVKFAQENNLHLKPSYNGMNLEESFIKMYDYYVTYYKIQVNEEDYLFKSEEEANNFTEQISKYDGQEYTIKTTTKLINNETEENEINEIVESKKQEYEEIQAEAKKKAEQEQNKSTTTYSSSSDDLSSLQSYAYDLVINSYGWSEEDFNALVYIINKESGWNIYAQNSSSGAYGLCQSLPGNKMASEGSDWSTNGETQVRWCLNYIKERYSTPVSAKSFWNSHYWF